MRRNGGRRGARRLGGFGLRCLKKPEAAVGGGSSTLGYDAGVGLRPRFDPIAFMVRHPLIRRSRLIPRVSRSVSRMGAACRRISARWRTARLIRPPRFSPAVVTIGFSLFLLSPGFAIRRVSGQPPASPVVVAPVIERELASRKSFVANVAPRRQSVIGSAVDGRVEEYFVEAGDRVQAKQPLAQLRTRTIEIELAGAEAELELRRAELEELRNGSRPDEIVLAEASASAAEAANEYAQARLARAESLFRDGTGLSRDEFESAQASALQAAAELVASQSSLRLVREGPRREQIEQAAARVAVQQQAVEGLRDRLERYTVIAPFDGFVSAELTEAGAWVKRGDPVAEVIEIDPVEVEVYIPESIVRFVRRDDRTEVRVDALPGETFEGRIDQLVPLGDARSRTFPVRISVDNPPDDLRHALLPGMLAKVSMPSETPRTWILVPKDALQLGGQRRTVFRVVDGKVESVAVETGPSLGSWIAVEPAEPGGLNPGDDVVTRGNERLRPGQPVQISERQTPPE